MPWKMERKNVGREETGRQIRIDRWKKKTFSQLPLPPTPKNPHPKIKTPHPPL